MLNIESEDLSNKVVLEVGSGRGDTTRKLVDLLGGKPATRLIVTDISDQFFPTLRKVFQNIDVQIEFICTGGEELQRVSDRSVDFLVCNYTLCAINSQTGLATLALKRFWEVLKPGGKLFVEEEFPIDKQDTPMQRIWAEKWRILKSAMIIVGLSPYNEIKPEILVEFCRLVGFKNVEWTEYTEVYQGVEALDFFKKRLNPLLKERPVESLQAGYGRMALNLQNKAANAGGMEIPFYQLAAQKSR